MQFCALVLPHHILSSPALLSAQTDAAAFARLLLRLGLPAALPLLLLLVVPPAACAAPRSLRPDGPLLLR